MLFVYYELLSNKSKDIKLKCNIMKNNFRGE